MDVDRRAFTFINLVRVEVRHSGKTESIGKEKCTFFSESAFFPSRKGLLKFQECFKNVLKMQDYEYMYEVCLCSVLEDSSHMENTVYQIQTDRQEENQCVST